MDAHQNNTRLFATFAVFLVVTVVIIWWSLALVPKEILDVNNSQQACTTEAKVCPDGKAVGRTGPNCEFSACPEGITIGDCRVTGCNKTVCSDQEVVTDCSIKPTDGCYTTANCERQASGNCAWTLTAELQRCLVEPELPKEPK